MGDGSGGSGLRFRRLLWQRFSLCLIQWKGTVPVPVWFLGHPDLVMQRFCLGITMRQKDYSYLKNVYPNYPPAQNQYMQETIFEEFMFA